MLTCNRILYASDFSASAEAALLYAAALARQTRAGLLLLHVQDTRVTALPHWTDVFRSTEVMAAQTASATQAMQRLLAHPALTGIAVEPFIQQGNPRERLVDAASYVDLVVLGTQGQGLGIGNKPGRTARYVAHASPTPVLLVPAGGGRAGVPAAGDARLPFRNILLALHFAQYAPQAIGLARALATTCQATLHILQVIEAEKVTSYPLEAGGGLYHNVDSIKMLVRKRFEALVPDSLPGLRLERHVLEGNPADTIVQHSATYASDLIVMSAHAYSALHKLFTVSTVDTVLEQAPCPLLAVPMPRLTAPSLAGGMASASAV